MRAILSAGLSLLALAACGGATDAIAGGNATAAAPAPAGRPFQVQALATFNEPWAMTFLPGNGGALITEKPGRLLLWKQGARAVPVAGVPKVDYGGQLGLGDVVLHPGFARNNMIYLSWSEPGQGDTRGAAVGRAKLVTTKGAPRLEGMQVIWRQDKVDGRFHHAHRLAFSRDGHLFITSGDRMKFEVAQDLGNNMGKVIRVTDTGGVPRDNPFASRGGTAAQVWSLGHRNPLGIALDAQGRLWTNEMGPRHGDEVNLIERGANYGWPTVSNGSHYDGRDIPDHSTSTRFNAPEVSWNPAISPAGMMIYSGAMFPQWRGSAFIGGLSGQALVRVAINGNTAREAERWPMDARIREIEQGPDGAIYVLEDERKGSGGRLLRLSPAR
jgi:glucose/arabinose dehydrogenase